MTAPSPWMVTPMSFFKDNPSRLKTGWVAQASRDWTWCQKLSRASLLKHPSITESKTIGELQVAMVWMISWGSRTFTAVLCTFLLDTSTTRTGWVEHVSEIQFSFKSNIFFWVWKKSTHLQKLTNKKHRYLEIQIDGIRLQSHPKTIWQPSKEVPLVVLGVVATWP